MRGDHAGLLKIEAECARRVRLRSTTSMIEGIEGGTVSGIWSDIGGGLYYWEVER
jgi:hypothetical protein